MRSQSKSLTMYPVSASKRVVVRGWKGIAKVIGRTWLRTRDLAKKQGSQLGALVRRDPDTGRIWSFEDDLIRWLEGHPTVSED